MASLLLLLSRQVCYYSTLILAPTTHRHALLEERSDSLENAMVSSVDKLNRGRNKVACAPLMHCATSARTVLDLDRYPAPAAIMIPALHRGLT